MNRISSLFGTAVSLFTCYFQDYKKMISSNRLLSDGFLENDYVYTCMLLSNSKAYVKGKSR